MWLQPEKKLQHIYCLLSGAKQNYKWKKTKNKKPSFKAWRQTWIHSITSHFTIIQRWEAEFGLHLEKKQKGRSAGDIWDATQTQLQHSALTWGWCVHWQLVPDNICTVCTVAVTGKVCVNFENTSSVNCGLDSVCIYVHRHDFDFKYTQRAGKEKRDELPLRRTLGEPQLRRPSSSLAGPRPPPECWEWIRRRVRETVCV